MHGDLTKKQQIILDYIRDEVQKKGYPPSVREICEGVGLKSTSTVHGHLNKLEDKAISDETRLNQELLSS